MTKRKSTPATAATAAGWSKPTTATTGATNLLERPTEVEVTSPQPVEAAPTETTEAETPSPQPVEAAPATAPATPAPAAKKAAVRPLTGVTSEMKRLVIADPKATIDEIAEKLKTAGFTPSKSTIGTIRSDFIHSCRILAELSASEVKAILKAVASPK